MHNMAKRKSPTPAANGSDGTTGKIAEQPAEYTPGNGTPTGGNVRTLKNGAIYDLDAGRIIGNPPGGPTTAIKTQSQAVALQKLSDQARLDAVYRGWMSVIAHVSGDALAGLFSLLAGRRADIDGDVVADGDIRDGQAEDVDE